MDGLEFLDDENDLQTLPLTEPPPQQQHQQRQPQRRQPVPVVVNNADDDDDAIITMVTPTKTTPRRQIVQLDICDDSVPPRRAIIEVDDLPIYRPSPPKAAAANPSPLAPPRTTPPSTPQKSPSAHIPSPVPAPSRNASSPSLAHHPPPPPAGAAAVAPVARAPSLPSPAPPPRPPPAAAAAAAANNYSSSLNVPPNIAALVAQFVNQPAPSFISQHPPPAPIARSQPPPSRPAAVASPVSRSSSSRPPPAAAVPPLVSPPPAAVAPLNSPSGIDAAIAVAAHKRGSYTCRYCGQPKRGHVCSAQGDGAPLPKRSKKKKTNNSGDVAVAASSLAPSSSYSAAYPPSYSSASYSQPYSAAAPLPSSLPPPTPAAASLRSPSHKTNQQHQPVPIPAAAAPLQRTRTPLDAAPSSEPGEERPHPWKAQATNGIRDRIGRALSQRLEVLERKYVSDIEQHFDIRGSIGNWYIVKICRTPSCSCPDFEKGNFCKHILFVYLKVLRVSSESPYIYQRGLLSSELRSIFQAAPRDLPRSVMADPEVQRRFKQITGEVVEVGRKAIAQHCPVCYEDLHPSQRLVWCRFSCGNNVHTDCFEKWSEAKKREGQPATCVYCRAPWPDGSGIQPVLGDEGYVNLSIPGRPTQRPEFRPWRSRSRYDDEYEDGEEMFY